MLIRVALLLLIASPVFTKTASIQNILKDVGKRYFPVEPEINKVEGKRIIPVEYSGFDHSYVKWVKLTPEQIYNIKVGTALRVIDAFIELSSSENRLFKDSLIWIQSISDPELSAEICGENKKMKFYEYMKFLTHFGSQHKGIPSKPKHIEIVDGPRDELRIKVELNHTDKFDLESKIEYDITMKLTFVNEKRGSLFSLSKVYQGGSCSEHGIVSYSKSDSIDMTIDNIEELKKHPNAKSLLKFFTPQIYQMDDSEPFGVPKFWLAGLVKDLSKISVCHEGVTEPVAYSIAQFHTWYNAFGLMWHFKKDEPDSIGLQVLEVKDDSIIARITMKLQIGPQDTVHDWNFKVSAKKNPPNYANVIQTDWHIEQLEVLCTPTIQLKDQSLVVIRDVVAQKFVNELVKLSDPSQWHSSVDFVNLFTKNGLEEFKYCDNEKSKTPQLDMFSVDMKTRQITKFIKYFVDHKDSPSPAPDSSDFLFKTVSVGDKVEYENNWKFEVKWDQMDQFYYVEKMEIGCHKKNKEAKNDGYVDINYGTRK